VPEEVVDPEEPEAPRDEPDLPSDDTGSAPVVSDIELLDDEQITKLHEGGHLFVDLRDGRDDPTVLDDARTLLLGAIRGIGALEDDPEHVVSLTWLRKGGTAAFDPEPPSGPVQIEDSLAWGTVAFNPGTANEFHLSFDGGLLYAIGQWDAVRGLDLGSPVSPSAEDADARSTPPQIDPMAWGGGVDDRVRIYDEDSDVTLAAHRRIVQMTNGCTGTLVGPRHVVTAGHCLWSRRNQAWSSGFDVRSGANGASEVDSVRIDIDDIPSGQALWYFTPAQFRNGGITWGFDYGILVLPARLGDEVGWMGRVTYGGETLQDANIFRRGYPRCQAFLSDGTPRIDEPSPCDDDHLYGNAFTCDVGEFESVDDQEWSRVFHHSCDASAADSGSPLYVYHNGTPSVTAVHFASRCAVTADDDECTGSLVPRPLAALRLTPEYRDLIGSFRAIFP
ncbi:MAG: trypsin-like serine protease, partial [Myxococcota bacterium]